MKWTVSFEELPSSYIAGNEDYQKQTPRQTRDKTNQIVTTQRRVQIHQSEERITGRAGAPNNRHDVRFVLPAPFHLQLR
jgi:hypothetical protein